MTRKTLNKPRLYTIGPSEGRGRGMFAATNFNKGELILIEKPVLSVRQSVDDAVLTDIQEALEKMNSKQRTRFMKLSANGGLSNEKVLKIFQTNAFYCKEDLTCVCIDISRINHSCTPNANWLYKDETDSFFVAATKPIRKGTEIFIEYAPFIEFYSAAQHKAMFQQLWNFECTCPACNSTTMFSQASDLRRVLMFGLFHILYYTQPGDVPRFQNYRYAVVGSNGKDLCRWDIYAWGKKYAQKSFRLFAWILFAKLLEAEGLCTGKVMEAYDYAVKCLQYRMLVAGHAGVALPNIKLYLDNIKVWAKASLDAARQLHRPAPALVYTFDGSEPYWIVTKTTGVENHRKGKNSTSAIIEEHALIYGKDGSVEDVMLQPGSMPACNTEQYPGNEFCDTYMKRFGHLYKN